MPRRLAEKLKTVLSSNQVFFAGKPGWLGGAEVVSGEVDLRSGFDARRVAAAGWVEETRRLKEAWRA